MVLFLISSFRYDDELARILLYCFVFCSKFHVVVAVVVVVVVKKLSCQSWSSSPSLLKAKEFSWRIHVSTLTIASIGTASGAARTVVDKVGTVGREGGIGTVEGGTNRIGNSSGQTVPLELDGGQLGKLRNFRRKLS